MHIAEKIPFTSGGTDFDEPLMLALKNMKENVDTYKSFNLMFMTDG